MEFKLVDQKGVDSSVWLIEELESNGEKLFLSRDTKHNLRRLNFIVVYSIDRMKRDLR